MSPLRYSRWPGYKCVDTLVYPSLLLVKTYLLPRLVRPPPEVKVVCVRQWREPNAKFFNVGAAQWVDAHKTGQIEVLYVSAMRRASIREV
jgi:hypothetical protein